MDRLKRLFERDKMGDEMAKDKPKKLVFKASGDALPVTKTPWGAVVRLPVAVSLPSKGRLTVDLRLTCNMPLILVPAGSLSGISDSQLRIVMPDERITLLLNNETGDKAEIPERATVLYAVPLGGEFDVETEGV